MISGNTTANYLNKLTVLRKKAVEAIENVAYNALRQDARLGSTDADDLSGEVPADCAW